MADVGVKVTFADQFEYIDTKNGKPINDGSPVSNPSQDIKYYALTGADGTNLKASGNNDRATLLDVAHDKDQVLNLGAGNDVFVFGVNDEKADIDYVHVNGTIVGGAGTDTAFFTHQISDYEFVARTDGSIKVTYIGEGSQGASVTFAKDFEFFKFNNISDDGVDAGTNYHTFELSYAQLYASILAADPSNAGNAILPPPDLMM